MYLLQTRETVSVLFCYFTCQQNISPNYKWVRNVIPTWRLFFCGLKLLKKMYFLRIELKQRRHFCKRREIEKEETFLGRWKAKYDQSDLSYQIWNKIESEKLVFSVRSNWSRPLTRKVRSNFSRSAFEWSKAKR